MRALARFFPLMLLGLATTARADVAAFSFPDPELAADSGRGTDGFRFTPRVDIEVTALGYYDRNQDGFPASQHQVAVYDFDSREQLAFAVVTTDSVLEGLFRYESIEPLSLLAGESYVVAGYTRPLTQSHVMNPLGFRVAEHLIYEGYRYHLDGNGVIFPEVSDQTNKFFGPNMLFTAATAPAPGDTNGDGAVNIEDLNNVRNQFGESGNPILGDTTPFDGTVDLADLNAVRNFFGTGSAVPEPAMLGLAAVAAVITLAMRLDKP